MPTYSGPRHPHLVSYLGLLAYAKFEGALMVALDIADKTHPGSASTMPRGYERYQAGIDAMQELIAEGQINRHELECFLTVVRMLEAAATVEVDVQALPSGSGAAH